MTPVSYPTTNPGTQIDERSKVSPGPEGSGDPLRDGPYEQHRCRKDSSLLREDRLGRRIRPRGSLQPISSRPSPTTASPRPSSPSEPEGIQLQPPGCYGWGPCRPVPINHTPVRSSLSSCFAPVNKPHADYAYCHEASSSGRRKLHGELCDFLLSLASCAPRQPSPNARHSGLLPMQCEHRHSDLLTDPPSPPRAAPRPASPGAQLWSTEWCRDGTGMPVRRRTTLHAWPRSRQTPEQDFSAGVF